MHSVFRIAVVYLVLLVIFRLAGKRTMAETTPFDFLTLLIVSETVQQAMVGEDQSLTTAIVLIATLVAMDVAISLIKVRSKGFDKLVDGAPLILVENGQPFADRMKKSRIDVDDVLEAARERMGLERMSQIKYAVLEKTGRISIVPAAQGESEL